MSVSPISNSAVENPDDGRWGCHDEGFKVADWVVEPAFTRITREGETTRLEPKVMDVLVYLANRPRQLVTREELEESASSEIEGTEDGEVAELLDGVEESEESLKTKAQVSNANEEVEDFATVGSVVDKVKSIVSENKASGAAA